MDSSLLYPPPGISKFLARRMILFRIPQRGAPLAFVTPRDLPRKVCNFPERTLILERVAHQDRALPLRAGEQEPHRTLPQFLDPPNIFDRLGREARPGPRPRRRL